MHAIHTIILIKRNIFRSLEHNQNKPVNTVQSRYKIHPVLPIGERQPSLNIGENKCSMEQEVESLIPLSNGYLY